MLKIVALYEYATNGRPHGSSYIRTLLPLDHPSLKGKLETDFSTEFRGGDILLIDRTWTPYIAPELAEQVVRQARLAGMKIVYSLDDNLMDVNEYFPFRKIFSEEQIASIRCFASNADHVITSTEPLRQRLKTLNSSLSVIPNYLDEQLFAAELPQLPARDKIVLGYMGTASHEADLLSILEPLRQLLHRYRDHISLELVGVIDPYRKKAMFGDLPVSVKTVPIECVEYPDFVQWMRNSLQWDIGLAPLEKTPFTACKSDIKWLDYSMQGIPAVFSRSKAYSNSVANNETGLIADTIEDWYNALKKMIDDTALRNRIREATFKTVKSTRTLEHNAVQWLNILKEIKEHA
jgi:glycosyltransferase involved in cell wall biosynthesis